MLRPLDSPTALVAAASFAVLSPNFSGGRKSSGKVNIPARKSCSTSPTHLALAAALSGRNPTLTHCHCQLFRGTEKFRKGKYPWPEKLLHLPCPNPLHALLTLLAAYLLPVPLIIVVAAAGSPVVASPPPLPLWHHLPCFCVLFRLRKSFRKS